MPRIVPALDTNNNISPLYKTDNDFTFTLVTPLSADNHTCCHVYILHVKV